MSFLYTSRRGSKTPGTIMSATTANQPGSTAPSRTTSTTAIFVVLVVVIAALAGGTIILQKTSGSQKYACVSVGHQGSDLSVTTTGLIHVNGTSYYVSCNEASTLPTGSLSDSCLTITAQIRTSSYPGAASTYYYELTTKTGSIMLENAPVNATEVIQPTSAYFLVSCS